MASSTSSSRYPRSVARSGKVVGSVRKHSHGGAAATTKLPASANQYFALDCSYPLEV